MPDIDEVINGLEKLQEEISRTKSLWTEPTVEALEDAIELLKQQHGLMLALEQANATINYLNEEKEKAIRDIDLYIADMKEDEGATYFRGTIYGLTIAKEILQGIRNHG